MRYKKKRVNELSSGAVKAREVLKNYEGEYMSSSEMIAFIRVKCNYSYRHAARIVSELKERDFIVSPMYKISMSV